MGLYDQHPDSEWIAEYEPIENVEELVEGDTFDLDKTVKRYMEMHGIDNVRGGTYTGLVLPGYQRRVLEEELATARGKTSMHDNALRYHSTDEAWNLEFVMLTLLAVALLFIIPIATSIGHMLPFRS